MHERSPFAVPFVAALVRRRRRGRVLARLGVGGEHDDDDRRPAVAVSPRTAVADGTARSPPRDIYKRDAPGVVYVRSQIVQRIAVPVRLPAGPAGRGDRLRLRDRRRGLHPHQRPRGRERRRRSPCQLRGQARPSNAKVVGKDPSTDLALLKVDPDGLNLQPLQLGDSEQRPGRRPDDRDRQPVRPRPHAHDRRRLGAAAPDQRAQRLHDRQRDPDRRRRSTPATPAARCSTRPAA